MSYSIRDKQTDALKQMLNLNQPVNDKLLLNEPSWKVLIYDRYGQDIISPLLSMKDLRDLGVTINLLLHSDRDPITDVPAIYFISPTQENIERLCQDFKNDLYESYFLNFISPIPRSQLEDIAQAAIEANCVVQIQKIYDQYLNFISLEDELFILRHQNREPISFYAFNKSDVKDTEIEQITNTVVDSLFSAFVTLGTLPIIRCPKNSAAEMIAEKLDKKLRENLRDARNNLFVNENISSGQLSFQRPLLLIIDRNFDLATPLHHTWTYQALLHDTMDLKLNRIEISEDRGKAKTYDLVNSDKFWKTEKGNPFPLVAEAIQEELEKYKQSEDELKSLKQHMEIDNSHANESHSLILADNTNKLTTAVSSLPELLEKKRLLDMHTNIATALLEQIKKRKLDVYFETEEKILSKANLERSIMDIITDPNGGSSEDKLRLFLIYYICSFNISQNELDQYLLQLQSLPDCNTDSIKFIKRYKSVSKMNSNQYSDSGTSTTGMFSNLLSKSSKFVMEGVKNFVVKQHRLPLTKIVDNLVELKSSPDIDDFRYFDPKLIRNDGANIPRLKTAFNDAMVFVVGGGNYIEYQNLLDNAKIKSTATSQKRVIYGCTELMNASMLLNQLSFLGKEII